MRRALLTVVLILLAWTGARTPTRAADGPFSDWAAVVVAGDWRATNGNPTEAFENARRDVSAALVAAGFSPDNVRQYSLRPAGAATPRDVAAGLAEAAAKAKGGCLFYLTSHGTPQGAVFGPDRMLQPAALHLLLNETCGARPTVVVVSACFSGVFVRPLAGPNRMVMTAARPDRSSFGCSERDRYPYFDACMLESLPKSADFMALAAAARACVARREDEMDLTPASEPQTAVGGELRMYLPLLRLNAR